MAEWFYSQNNQQLGPISWDELRQLASSGLLQPSDMIWKEGMVDWLKAVKKDGLFAERSDGRGDDREAPAPRRSRERDRGDDDATDDRPRRRRSGQGMPLGAKVAIIGGSIAVGLLILVIVIVLLVGGTSSAAFRTVLMPGQEHSQSFMFNAGQTVRITVRSQASRNTDVDLFVYRANGGLVIADQSVGKDSFVQFTVPATEMYRVRVHNLHGGMATCDVYIR